MLEESASLFATNPKAKENEPGNIFNLPSVIIQEIVLYLDDKSLFSFEQTCKRHYSIIAKSQLYKKRCFREFEKRFEQNINEVYSCSVEVLSWKMKYLLTKFFPKKMISLYPKEVSEVDDDGLTLTSDGASEYLNCRTEVPFLTCNKEVLKTFPKLAPLFFKQGVEYFEITLLQNTVSWNMATAIGISGKEFVTKHYIVGWAGDTIGYHSDDGSVQSKTESIKKRASLYNPKPFSKDDTVGFGILWEKSQFFLTCNGKLVFKSKYSFNDEYFPSVSIMCPNDKVKVNLGDSPFVFDIQSFVISTKKSCVIF